MFPSLEIPGIKTLSQVPQWILWRLEERGGKPAKIPRDPKQGRNASVTNPKHWGTWEEAYEGFTRYENDGIGFVFTSDDPFVGVDLDHCRDKDTGVLDVWAQGIVDKLNSYTEISPSGTGVHIICQGELAGKKRRRGQVECYTERRYFTVTGECPAKWGKDIRVIGEPLDWVFDVGASPSPIRTERPDHDRVPLPTTEEHSALEAELNPHAVADADVHQERLTILFENSEIVKKVWELTAVVGKDWSPSEWDLSLANYFVSAGWPNVEIMRGLIAFRRKWGHDLKLDRDPPSYYYARTIITARSGRDRDEAQESISAAAIDNVLPGHLRQHVLGALTKIYDMEIISITKFPATPNRYEIKTENGTVSGTIDMLISQMMLRKAIADGVGIVIPKVKAARHDERCQSMLSIAEEGDIGDEATEDGQIRAWITSFIMHPNNPLMAELSPDVIVEGNPFYKDEHIHIPGGAFRLWLSRNLAVNVSSTQFGAMMRGIGCEPRAVNTKINEKKTSFSTWKIPHEVMK